MAQKKTVRKAGARPARQASGEGSRGRLAGRAGRAAGRKPGPAIRRTTRVLEANDRTFAELIATGGLPVLVDFSASWCEPCRALARVLPEVARKFARRLRVVTIDVDRNPRTADRFAIEGVPTLLLFQDGRLIGASEGFGTRRSIEAWLSDALSGRQRGPHGAGCRCGD
ncbi:MAG: thioredoxin family protein [Myxococcales bacterium]|nr:thioredoxin family protein [Myxococcales bacterium]